MTLTIDDVRKIARLARLAITESEAIAAQSRLQNIFSLIEEMQAVDTSGIAPMSHALDITQRLCADVVTEQNQRELFQSIAPQYKGSPQVEAGLYLVPQVIE